jgi:sugar phosphate isomerase/epimerase
MKISFSTLGCPSWKVGAILDLASREKFDGVELRFIENDDQLWKRPEFTGHGLRETLKRIEETGIQISCLDTSCFFHDPDRSKRQRMIEQGKQMAELAAHLGAPGIRVFGDTIQPGATRELTRDWVAESIHKLNGKVSTLGVEVWLETHGDFTAALDTVEILNLAGGVNLGAVWDPGNAYAEGGEDPATGMRILGNRVRHVHVKDLKQRKAGGADSKPVWDYVLMGEGDFPAGRLLSILSSCGYHRFVSFEWEKKWHPEIPDPEIALPHFARWARKTLAAGSS